jgi:hypothetical protein
MPASTASAILARSVFRHGQLRRPAPGSLSATGSLVIWPRVVAR